jgi:hypothetical protein
MGVKREIGTGAGTVMVVTAVAWKRKVMVLVME